MTRCRKFASGQATIESMVTLFLFLLLSAAVVQVLWLFAIQQLSQAATLYAAKHGARDQLQMLPMRMSYAYRMRTVPGVNPLWVAIDRVYPEDALLTRMSTVNEHGERLLTAGFHGPRMSELDEVEKEEYLDVRVLSLAIRLCVDLKVPLVANLLSAAQTQVRGKAPCAWLGQTLVAPFEIVTQATVPIESVIFIQ
ncbi:hypothetical protein FM042_00300 [Aliidiomarina halalkaliphila]|uniref:Pilus assembly protein TadE n=1 Tax=Aliidiomarina halalkaliphila TaxID=2593535 RepID=A0A552X2T3_9GAMM|nr:hypothetical protein [Aliidiomarina halalkaliphila]TRW49352.1 hypothetical protein FM042_00300 [Aliidiomarina halalkaliphila]